MAHRSFAYPGCRSLFRCLTTWADLRGEHSSRLPRVACRETRRDCRVAPLLAMTDRRGVAARNDNGVATRRISVPEANPPTLHTVCSIPHTDGRFLRVAFIGVHLRLHSFAETPESLAFDLCSLLFDLSLIGHPRFLRVAFIQWKDEIHPSSFLPSPFFVAFTGVHLRFHPWSDSPGSSLLRPCSLLLGVLGGLGGSIPVRIRGSPAAALP